ncbi:MAG: hypothetical protein QXT39_06260 [Conexivisphaerales archaeon]
MSLRIKLLKYFTLSRQALFLFLAVILISVASSIPYQSILQSTEQLNYAYLPNTISITSINSITPFTGSVTINSNITSCNNYSAVIAFPAILNGLRTVVRGEMPSNISRYVHLNLISGFWPSTVWQIAVGYKLAKSLAVSNGSIVDVKDMLTGSYSSFVVTGIYHSSYDEYNSEAIVTVEGARSLTQLADNQYTYIIMQDSCSRYVSSLPSVSPAVNQLVARLLHLQPFTYSSSYGIYSPENSLSDDLAVMLLIIVLGSSISLWMAGKLYLNSFAKTIIHLKEQGVSSSYFISCIILPIMLLSIFTCIVGFLLSSFILEYAGDNTLLYSVYSPVAFSYLLLLLLPIVAPLVLSLIAGLKGDMT